MFNPKIFLSKILPFSLSALAVLGLTAFVYATVDRTKVTSQELIVVPGEVSGVWSGMEQSLVSDISEQSLYQNFSVNNSAFLESIDSNTSSTTPDIPPVEVGGISTSTSSSTANENQVSTSTEDTDTDQIPVENAIGSTTPVDNAIGSTTPVEDNVPVVPPEDTLLPYDPGTNAETPTTPTAPTVDSTSIEEITPPENPVQPEAEAGNEQVFNWGLFPKSSGFFPLAQAVLTDYVSTTPTEIIEPAQQIEPVVETPPAIEERLSSTTEISNIEDIDDQETTIEDDTVLDPVLTEEDPKPVVTTADSSTTNAGGIETADTENSLPTESGPIPTPYSVCAAKVNCAVYPIEFSGFSVPEFDSGTFVTNVDLRLSLAAKLKANAQPQQFVVEYSYGGDTTDWKMATIIDIDDEISNSINGGYFLISLAESMTEAQLANLKVRVSYLGDISELKRAYVESAWIEITSSSFYEEEDAGFGKDAITYSRDLEQPTLHELFNTDEDISISKLPSFTLNYSPQQNVLKRIATAIFGENSYKVSKVEAIDSSGAVLDVPIKVTYQDDTTWTLSFQKQPQKMKPGKYKLRITVDENESFYVDEFEFYWGVLAVNTTKSMYSPEEKITLNLAALTDRGDTICDANLELKIISPSNTIHEIPVRQSGACGKNNVTDIPDYLADFSETNEIGQYTIQLHHLNKAGEVVHKIQDHFEVRDYIPYDIERSAPTRIYPPSPYTVKLDIKANRTFTGDITERVPRGFVFADTSGAEVTTLTDATLLTWKNITMDEGDQIQLSYVFDAPDISPYTYLLGPLDMAGFSELRQWQIASDALNSVAYLTGTSLTGGAELNNTSPDAIVWSTSTLDSFYFSFSTSTPQRLSFTKDGDYLVSLTMPITRSDTDTNRVRFGTQLKINDTPLPDGVTRTGYIRGTQSGDGHSESSNNSSILLTNIKKNDYLTVFSELLTTYDTGVSATIDGQASLYVEYIGAGQNVFAATTTYAIASSSATSTDLNDIYPSTLSWIETRQDSGFVHSDSLNPQNIIISDPGSYLVKINIPLTTAVNTTYQNVLGRVLLDGVEVPAGKFATGRITGRTNTGDGSSSLHWSGVVTATTTNQVLTITGERESSGGAFNITDGLAGSIFIQKLPATNVIVLRGNQLVSNSNDWNPATGAAVEWESQDVKDSVLYTHSTSTNPQDIIVNTGGDYYLTYNDALSISSGQRRAPKVTINVNGVPVVGAEAKTNYLRYNVQNHASAMLATELPGLTASSTINVVVTQEANTGTVSTAADAIVMLWKKAELNFRPTATATSTPFDNILFSSTTPSFGFVASDPDGSSNLQYEFQIATSADFVGALDKVSGVDAGFQNLDTPGDTSPFNENEKIIYQIQAGDSLSNNTTYYWRARAKDVSGSNEYGDWTTTKSLTVKTTNNVDKWHQTTADQFLSNTIIGLTGVGDGGIGVDVVQNSEAMLVYGERTDTQVKYRLWNGSTWGSEVNGPNINSEIYWAESASGITRDEYSALFLTADGHANAMVYSASTSSWGNQLEMTTTASTPARRGIGLTYESISGKAMAVSCTAGADPIYSLWDGSSWSATSSIDVTETNDCNWLTLASNPVSNEIIMLIQSAAGSIEALVWNGSTWGDSHILGRLSTVSTEGFSVVYEESGDQAVAVSSDLGDNEFVYSTWNGTDWQSNLNVPLNLAHEFETGHLVRDEGTDRVGFCFIDNAYNVNAMIWDGDAWGTQAQLSPTSESVTGRGVDCEFETVPGRDGNFLVAYSTNATDAYQYFNGTTWSGQLDMSDMEEFWYLQTARTGDGTILAVGMQNVGLDPLGASEFNGTYWSSSTLIEADPADRGTGSENESFSLAAKRFSYAQGSATTLPINFSFVPGQPSWGDFAFNTTEPVGTNVLIRLKYSNVGTCDSYIPNGALAGNDSGFESSQSPIDLSGLSTTTYSQICLEATISRNGDITPTLNDWTLSWVREPKLVQNSYRWYANGSFLTPTDPWPLGVLDLSEKTPLSADEAISIDETIRLRMSLEGLGVPTPTSTETFKLQYATGLTCSAAADWNDVAGTGSSTAIWRGYENSIVGSDWYDADWSRRVKITVDKTKVTEGLTDFPVYVNLANLPNTFFANVQADGDDIRLTKDDGLTELPFELVSINTGSKTGELYFKTNVSSTTDSKFYLYYGNSGASGYANTATYGRNNTWNNNFEGVWHMNNSGTTIIDSTGNGYTGNKGPATAATTEVSSPLGAAQYCDGNDYIDFGDVLDVGTNKWTITTWHKPTAVGTGDQAILYNKENLYEAAAGGNRHTYAWQPHWSWDGGTSFSTAVGTWYHGAVVYDKVNQRMYKNGSSVYSRAQTGDIGNNTARLQFCARGDTAHNTFFTGQLDEVRMSKTDRSAGWLAAEYSNEANPSGFYAVSSEELISDGKILPSTLLASSTYPETYEEFSPTRDNQHTIAVGSNAEWDFVLQNHGGTANTNYCFRMVYDDGAELAQYRNYPRLITNAPPLTPDNIAPFDNEQTASSSPWFEFAAEDALNNDVSYQIEIDNDHDFGSPEITRESNANFSQFTNLSNPSQRGIYTAGQVVQFIPNTSLSNNTTYWWRVRAKDDNGSGAYGAWSTPTSVTMDNTTTITTWFQTTQEQFETNNYEDAAATVSDDVRINSGFTVATTTSTAINFSDVDTGNAWGEVRFVDNESSGDIKYQVEHQVSVGDWELIPDSDLPANSSGFDTSPVNIANVSPVTYPTIRLKAVLSGNSTLPQLQSWSVLWGKRIEPPVQIRPFNNAKVDSTTPTLTFVTSDPQGDDLQYELEIDDTSSFSSPTTLVSGIDSGFSNVTTPADTPNYNSGDNIQYIVQSALSNNQTYWWRLRARDPSGDNAYSDWSTPASFTVDTSLTYSTWYQTTGEQFSTNDNTNIEPDATTAKITTTIREAMVAYGESTSFNPQYRLWSGSEWSDPSSALGINALVEWTELKAAPTRSEYALGTLGNDGRVIAQIYNSNNSTWGNQTVIKTSIPDTNLRAMDIAYETVSGKLLALACDGSDALYSVWNGSTWSATSSINLANANDCNYIKLTSDPTSNEIMAVFRHTNTGSPDYEALVWNGSSWGHSNTFGNMSENANEGIAVEYEESGNQAVVVVSNGNTAGFVYDTWNGSSWSGQLTFALQDDFEHGVLKRDVGSDRLALCAIDNDGQISQTFWNGAAWGSYTTMTTTGNAQQGRPVSCEFETTAGRDGYLMIPYSTTISAAYQYYATSSYSGELPLGTITDAWTTQTIRTADGLIMAVYLQDTGSVAPTDRFEFIYWDGTAWTGYQTLSGVPSVVTTPVSETISMAAQTYPNFDSGNMLSTPIKFSDGDGPRWQEISWHDAKPGASTIKYHVYYESTPDTYTLIPNSALPGNSAGFTSSPIDISALDTNTYGVIKLEAQLDCVSGDCPSVLDWSVAWSEGISVSGTASAYDQVTPLENGTVAVAVNGVLQVGKTATIASGLATEKAIYNTVGTSTFTVPAGVSEVTIKAWGAGGGGGAGGSAEAGASGGGGGYTEATLAVTPSENLTILTGGAGQSGKTGSPAGAGGGGGYSGVYRGSTTLMISGAGGGGGAGAGGISYAGVGTACAVSGASCTPTIPSGGYENDVLIAVVESRTDTAHTCSTNCTGWTEFSTQAGTNGRLSVWYFRRGTSTPPNPTFAGPATDSYVAKIWSFRGVTRSGNPYEDLSANTTQAANTTYVGSSLTSTVSNVMTIFVGGALDDNTWGPGGGACTVPNSVDPDFYVTNALGNDNSVFLCFNDQPTNSAGPLSVPTMTQATLGPDAGRWFTFTLKPDTNSLTSAGAGGAGGGLTASAGGDSGNSTGGGAGTQSAGGSAGGGSATAGSSLIGGAGGYGTNGGAGGSGGTHGGGAGGAGDSYTAEAGGAGGGAGYFGGGGGREAASSTLSGAGGGGGSSYITSAATATSTQSGTGTTAGNNGDADYSSGAAVGGAGGATNTDGTNGGVGRVVVSWLATTTSGTWTINNVNVSAGDVVTVFIDGASSTGKAVGVTKYDGAGDITNMELNERHLTIGSDDNATTTNANLGLYDTANDSDIFFDVSGGNVLTLCALGNCSDARLKIKSANYYQPGANGVVNNFQNYGIFLPQTNTLRVANAWQQFGTFTPDTSTIIFTATTSSSTLLSSTSTLLFNNVTFGESSGGAIWTIEKPLTTLGALTINYGTLARGTSSINIAGNLTLSANGYITGLATTTFDGTGTNNWTDGKLSASSTNIGNVVIDGSAKTITLGGNVGAESITIGSDDTLNSSGSGYNINVVKNWTNLNLFVPQTGTVTFIGTSTGLIARGVSPFNNLSFTGVGGNWSFSTSTLAINGNLTIATGTVTLPTGTTTVGRSFLNTGGTFSHNNGEVRMTSTVAGQTITQNATAFLNAFYDLVFTGSGAWSFGSSSATTTRNFNINSGTVTLPSGNLTVGGDFNTSGSGSFVHNSGTLTLLTGANNILKTNGSALNNLSIGGGNGAWLNSAWEARVPIIINANQVTANQTDFPVYVNLADLPNAFFSGVQASGADIRVTKADGLTEVPFELVVIATSTKIGELYFKGDVSSSTNTTFYIYYNNPSAVAYSVTDTYGRNNVWSNSYEGVWHMSNTGSTVIDSTGKGYTATKGGGGAAPTETTSLLGKSQSFDGNDYLDLGNVLSPGASDWTISTWYKPTVTGTNQAGILYNKENVYEGSAGGNNHQYAWMPSWTWYDGSGVSFPTTVGNWYYAVDLYDHVNQRMYKNGVSVYSRAQTGNIGSGASRVQFGARGDAGHSSFFTGEIDELRMSSVARSAGWIATEYNNQSSSSVFYTVSASEQKNARIFTDTNATILGNYYAGNSSEAVFPTGVLSVGGSFTNDAQFNANNGTVRFNSTAGTETINSGQSNFATLEFNSATGDFTVIQNATATKAINLSNVQQFTLSSGKTLTTLGTFTEDVSGSNTTWTGSTLRLASATTTILNNKTHGGDVYDTIEAASSTLVKMWNSSANNYVTNSLSAVYSQDHAGVDGDLYIFGNYKRTTGTEYWSAATDFDGTALGALARAVNVRVASSSSVGLINASLNLVGTSTASTSINSQAGTFGLNATNTTVTAQFFTVAGTNASGFVLGASSTLSTFNDGFLSVTPTFTGLTFDTSTINTNPSAQFFRIGFATSSPGTASNVTFSGSTTSSYIWFRNGYGALYGENYDANDANPGSIRWDDSSNSIVISGRVYADDGVTPLGAPTCNGVTPNVRVVVDGGAFTASTTCAAGTGNYSFPSVNYIGDPRIVVYLNTGGGVTGSVLTKTPSGNVTNMNIYANRVIVRHEDIASLSIADMVKYDSDDDPQDLKFTAATGTPDTLVLAENTELYVFASSTFAPGGNITLNGNANANGYEGTLAIGTGATFKASSTELHTLAGRLVLNSGASFVPASSTLVFNATTTGKSITAPSNLTINNVQFNGVGGGWNIGANITVLGDMDINQGTVTGTGDITMENGSLSGNGLLSLGSGTTTLSQSSLLGGNTGWTFANLTLGNGLVVGTTTLASNATTTILGTLTIKNAHFLNAGGSVFDLAGTGNVFVNNGTFNSGTSTIRYSGAGANVTSLNYYNLLISAGVGSPTYTAIGSGLIVNNNLQIGGATNSTFNLNTNDPALLVSGDVQIASNGTLSGSNSASSSVLGNWSNAGTYNGNGGTVSFTGSGTTNIEAGNSAFSKVIINGTGDFNLTNNATTTDSFTLTNHNNFTLSSGKTLAVGGLFTNGLGGGLTTWTGSTLALFGTSTYQINASTTADTYENLRIASGTQIRMWNSSASSIVVDNNGSLYSQDHAAVNGDLYIWGKLQRTSGNDYWSYTTDFDGTNLTGGSERIAKVYFASGASALFSGSASLTVLGSSSASTTVQNQGSGTYDITFGSGATTNWNKATIRNTGINGVIFAGTPSVTDFSYIDQLVEIASGSAITVGGTAINANPAKNFTNNIFNSSASSTKNVTATGTAVSSWRFTNHLGNIAGEAFDSDPTGDPGYIVWDNSAALISVSGNVYSDEGSTVLTSVCDGSTNSVRLVVAGITTYDTSCDNSTGAYTISNVAFSPLDTLTLYLNGTTPKAANVTISPISSIYNMNLYQNRVIVRHENTDPIKIANMTVFDSSDDADIPFTAVDAGTDTLTLPANTKLLIWTGKTFEPNGDVTLSGGGGGADYDGTLEAQTNSVFRAKGTEAHSVGGSLLFGNNAQFISASSTMTLSTTGSGRTVDVNSAAFNNLTFSGSGSWNITDNTLTVGGDYAQSSGAVTFGTGTSTFSGAFNATGGSFANSGSKFFFNTSGSGKTVRFNNSPVSSLTFAGSGSWNMTDTNATNTGSLKILQGGVTLPSGSIAIGGSFENVGGTITHNTSDLIMTATSSAVVTASSSNLYALRFVGPATFTMTDNDLTLADSFEIASGSVTLGTGTLAVAGSFTATGGTFTHASGTVLLNAASSGKVVNPGTSNFYNLQFGAPSGGYTLYSATTTNNLTLASASSLLISPSSIITVGGVFSNNAAAATTWTNTTLNLSGANAYTINSKATAGDTYSTLNIGNNSDIRMWNSSAVTTVVASSSSLYSQDQAGVDGVLYVYGDLPLATSTEYWSYAQDFDGTVLSGLSRRQAKVYFAANATTTLTSGALQIIGALGQETKIQSLASSTYAMIVNGGTLNANYYQFNNLNTDGLQLKGLSTITDLTNGYFEIATNTAFAITLSSTTLNANPSKLFTNVGFNATGSVSGYNVNLIGDTVNAWRFPASYGSIAGEAYDIDGFDDCGSIRFDDSDCLLTEETHFRWRNDDGGEAAPDGEWFDNSWDYRQRVRLKNQDAESYATTAVKLNITYDSSMKADFSDLRFTGSDGQTPLSYWLERYTASTDATVWVKVPSLPASSYATTFMYYGNSSASSTSSGTSTFAVFDDYEDNSISEYGGDTSLFQTDTTPVYGGTYALEAANKLGRTTDGIYRTDVTVQQGQRLRWMQYVSTSGDEACTLFGVQSPGANNNNYAVCLERFGINRLSIAKNVSDNDASGAGVLASTTVTYATGWYEVEVDWRTDDSIRAYLYKSDGTFVASTTATDSSYTSGGFGYTFWFQNGSWDSFTARPRVTTPPTVYFGVKQTDGGASWASLLDASGSGLPGDKKRLRFSVENSGIDITGQQFRLEYSLKGVAPTCESVSGASYLPVPNQSSCGTSPICMATSSNVSNGLSTTDQLFSTAGTFSPGALVTDPSNQTASLDIDQRYYTELEYVLTPTINATDALCLRLTNAGTELDFYNKVAELGLKFDPQISTVAFNEGNDISLTPGTTTTVYATTSVTDFNGYTDLTHATATIYRSGAGAACTPNDNDCYSLTTDAGQCTFSSCSGNSCDLICKADIEFYADPTDYGTYDGQEWLAYLEVEDTVGGYDFASAPGIELTTLRALSADSLINYGALEVNSDTGSYNASTTIVNLGNVPINIDVEATDLTDGGSSLIPASQQKMSTSTFSYSSCVSCYQLSSSTPVNLNVNLSKPTVVTPPVETDVYWGIAVPYGVNSAPHTGTNVFTPVGVP